MYQQPQISADHIITLVKRAEPATVSIIAIVLGSLLCLSVFGIVGYIVYHKLVKANAAAVKTPPLESIGLPTIQTLPSLFASETLSRSLSASALDTKRFSFMQIQEMALARLAYIGEEEESEEGPRNAFPAPLSHEEEELAGSKKAFEDDLTKALEGPSDATQSVVLDMQFEPALEMMRSAMAVEETEETPAPSVVIEMQPVKEDEDELPLGQQRDRSVSVFSTSGETLFSRSGSHSPMSPQPGIKEGNIEEITLDKPRQHPLKFPALAHLSVTKGPITESSSALASPPPTPKRLVKSLRSVNSDDEEEDETPLGASMSADQRRRVSNNLISPMTKGKIADEGFNHNGVRIHEHERRGSATSSNLRYEL